MKRRRPKMIHVRTESFGKYKAVGISITPANTLKKWKLHPTKGWRPV